MPSRAGSSRHKAVLRPAGSGRPAGLPRPARGRDSRPGCSRNGPASLGRLSLRSRDVVKPPHRGISQKAGQSDTGGLSQSDTACRAQMGSGQPDAVGWTPSDTPCQAWVPAARYGPAVSQPAVVRQTDHTLLGPQAPMKSGFRQTQPDRRISRQ